MQIQAEQKKLLKNHTNIFEFIKQYSMTYDLQKKVPYKVLLKDIPDHDNIEIKLFEELHKILKENKIENTFLSYKTFENLLNEILQYEFYDREFLEKICNAYKKVILIFIDNVESYVLQVDNIVSGYSILKFYCNKNVNFLNLFEEKITNNLSNKLRKHHVFCKILKFYKDLVQELHQIDLDNTKSLFYTDIAFQKKISLSLKISDLSNVFHDFDTLITNVNVKVKEELKKYSKEKAYLRTMDYSSELVLENVINNNEIIEDLKMFANDLIQKKR